MKFNEEFDKDDDEDNNLPKDTSVKDYWDIINRSNLGDVKNNIDKLFVTDQKGEKYKAWQEKYIHNILPAYLKGVQNGVKSSMAICLEDFVLYIYVIENCKLKLDGEKQTPELIKNKEYEDKVAKELDDIINGLTDTSGSDQF